MHTDDRSRNHRVGVESFFQDFSSESGLRAQVNWTKEHLALSDTYFANMLHLEPDRFTAWEEATGSLSQHDHEVLRAFWRLYLHVRSFYSGESEAVRELYDYVPTSDVHDPPWSGTSIKAYIETHGDVAIHDVHKWLERLRVPQAF